MAASACLSSASSYCFYSYRVCLLLFEPSRSKPESAGLDGVLGFSAEAGSRPGGRGTCSLLRQRKVPKRKATPSLRPLRCAAGQSCVVSVAGCAVELALRCARRSDSHGESVHEAWALRRPCSPHNRPAAGAASRGGEPNIQQPNSHTGHRCARPSLRSAWRLRPRDGAERSAAKQWPVWMCVLGFPSASAEKRRAGGACVCRRTHALRALTCRSCLNGARSAQ